MFHLIKFIITSCEKFKLSLNNNLGRLASCFVLHEAQSTKEFVLWARGRTSRITNWFVKARSGSRLCVECGLVRARGFGTVHWQGSSKQFPESPEHESFVDDEARSTKKTKNKSKVNQKPTCTKHEARRSS